MKPLRAGLKTEELSSFQADDRFNVDYEVGLSAGPASLHTISLLTRLLAKPSCPGEVLTKREALVQIPSFLIWKKKGSLKIK